MHCQMWEGGAGGGRVKQKGAWSKYRQFETGLLGDYGKLGTLATGRACYEDTPGMVVV